ncbi:MAG: 5,10-methylenetetrahydrofolate reductase [Candidatus Lokiarchaeota archaeon]|nr:5,10-methylenetetrahydrofolate reductase [Candidatus Lokiarchaeota archaeon]
MIVTQKKEFKDILENLDKNEMQKVIIIGCSLCATKCHTGGEDQVKEMANKLTENDKEVVATMVFEEPCDFRLTRRDYNKLKRENDGVKEADGALIMSCGLGCQAFQSVTGHTIVPSNDTVFMGVTERLGNWHEYCRACGNCLLGETGGICPITRCAKSLVNGPCGGCQDGKCEYGGYVNDCAWALIYEKLKKEDTLENFMKFRPPKNYILQNNPRHVPPTWTMDAPEEE